jgi:hypothetical protein
VVQTLEPGKADPAHGVHAARRAGLAFRPRRQQGADLRYRDASPSSANCRRRRRAAFSSPAAPIARASDEQTTMTTKRSTFACSTTFSGIFRSVRRRLPNWRSGSELPRAVLRALEALRREGKISRVGAVFAPKRIGASTLAAMAVPPEKLAGRRGGQPLSRGQPQLRARAPLQPLVRRHRRFGRAPAGGPGRDRAGGRLAAAALPLLEEYHIDLGFALDGQKKAGKPAPCAVSPSCTDGRSTSSNAGW